MSAAEQSPGDCGFLGGCGCSGRCRGWIHVSHNARYQYQPICSERSHALDGLPYRRAIYASPSRSAQRRRHGNLRRTRPFCSQAATAEFRRRRSSRSRRTTAIWIRGSTACRGMSSRSWSSRAVRPRRMRRLWPARRSGAIGVPASCCRNCRCCRSCRCRRCRRCRRCFRSFPSCRYCLSS